MVIERKMITTNKEMLVEKCKKCGKQITGFSKNQLKQRMKLHLSGCELKEKRLEH